MILSFDALLGEAIPLIPSPWHQDASTYRSYRSRSGRARNYAASRPTVVASNASQVPVHSCQLMRLWFDDTLSLSGKTESGDPRPISANYPLLVEGWCCT